MKLLAMIMMFGLVSCVVGEESDHSGAKRTIGTTSERNAREAKVLHRLCKRKTLGQFNYSGATRNDLGYIHAYNWQHHNWRDGDGHYAKLGRANAMKYMLTGYRPQGEPTGMPDRIKIPGKYYTWYNKHNRKAISLNSLASQWLDKHATCLRTFENGFPVIGIDDLEIVADDTDHTWYFIGLDDGSMTVLTLNDPERYCRDGDEIDDYRDYVCRQTQVFRFDAQGRGHSDFYDGRNYKIIDVMWFDEK